MSSLFPFELVSPENLVFSGEVLSVQVPGAEGDFEVLANHAPVMTTLRPGILTVQLPSENRRYFVDGGFADVNQSGLTVLAGEATAAEELTGERLTQAVSAAEALFGKAVNDRDAFNQDQKLTALRQLQGA